MHDTTTSPLTFLLLLLTTKYYYSFEGGQGGKFIAMENDELEVESQDSENLCKYVSMKLCSFLFCPLPTRHFLSPLFLISYFLFLISYFRSLFSSSRLHNSSWDSKLQTTTVEHLQYITYPLGESIYRVCT